MLTLLGEIGVALAIFVVGYLTGLVERRANPGRAIRSPARQPLYEPPQAFVDPTAEPEPKPSFMFDRTIVRRTFRAEDYQHELWCVREHPLVDGKEFLAIKLITPGGAELGEAACCLDHLPPYLGEELHRVQVDG